MRSEWETLTLAQAGIQLIDCDHRTPPAAPDGYPYVAIPQLKDGHIALNDVRRISAEHFAEWTKKLRPREHDVVVVRRCNSGTSAVVPKGLECAIGQNLVVLQADGRRVTPPFLRWLVRGEEWWEQVRKFLNVGAVFDSLKCRDIPNFEVLVPPLHEQHAICRTLNAIDERIGLLRQTNATLESIAQAMFKSWFIDFDPVRAKAEGREPEGMDAATAALFPAEFEESALGLIPKGWETSTLGSLCELTKGCSYKGEGLSEEDGAFMFNLGCFNAQRVFATEKVKRYRGEYRPRHAVSPGDLIIANTDMTQARDILGRPAIVPHGFEPGFVSHHVFKVTVRAQGSHVPAALRHFLFFTFREPTFRERAIGFATGTTVLALPASAVTDCPACIPDAASLLAWNDIVQPLFDAIRLNEARAEQLVSLRNTLLPRLISGKLRLPEAQDRVEDAIA